MPLTLALGAYLLVRSLQDSPAGPTVETLRRVELPMIRVRGNTPVVEVKIGEEKYRFLLDTGAGATLITSTIGKAMHLPSEDILTAGDGSGKNQLKAKQYHLKALQLGHFTLHSIVAYEPDGMNSFGNDFQGILNVGSLSGMLLTLDFPRRKVTLIPGKLTDEKAALAIPYDVVNGLPSVKLHIADLSIDATLDSGSDGGVAIPHSLEATLKLDGKPVVGQFETSNCGSNCPESTLIS